MQAHQLYYTDVADWDRVKQEMNLRFCGMSLGALKARPEPVRYEDEPMMYAADFAWPQDKSSLCLQTIV